MVDDATTVAGVVAFIVALLAKVLHRTRANRAVAPAAIEAETPTEATETTTAGKGEAMQANDRYNSLIGYYAKEAGIEPLLLKSLIRQESNFNPAAVSPVGARGLTQFMPATAADYHVRDHAQLDNPETAIRLGAEHLAHLLRFWSNVPDPTQRIWFALASYNAGQGNIQKARNKWLSANAAGESYKTNRNWMSWPAVSIWLASITGDANAHETLTYVARINHFWDLYAGRSTLADTGGAIANTIR
ncbi:transglycosylase SLT domain-containing protein [Draconibacterium sp.]|nr:transglycosylase SLT domain-containing protein [Draconibacterium sp.]